MRWDSANLLLAVLIALGTIAALVLAILLFIRLTGCPPECTDVSSSSISVDAAAADGLTRRDKRNSRSRLRQPGETRLRPLTSRRETTRR